MNRDTDPQSPKPTDSAEYLFKFQPLLGMPEVMAPLKSGLTSVAVQFVIPDLHLGQKQQDNFLNVAHSCGFEVWKASSRQLKTKDGKRDAVLVCLTFQVPEPKSGAKDMREIENRSRLIVERFLGILSFTVGIRFSAQAVQVTTAERDGKYSVRLDASAKSKFPSVRFELPPVPLLGKRPSADWYSALSWLRRGLAERDPLEVFSALTVSIQILAREVVPPTIVSVTCPKCESEIGRRERGVTYQVRTLFVDRLGESEELFERFWKARNAIPGHGNKAVTAETFQELTELRAEGIRIAYKALKLALGMNRDGPPHPHQNVFITSTYLHVD